MMECHVSLQMLLIIWAGGSSFRWWVCWWWWSDVVDGWGRNAEPETDWEGTAARNISPAHANTHTTTVLPAEQGSMMASENEPHTHATTCGNISISRCNRKRDAIEMDSIKRFFISYFNYTNVDSGNSYLRKGEIKSKSSWRCPLTHSHKGNLQTHGRTT